MKKLFVAIVLVLGAQVHAESMTISPVIGLTSMSIKGSDISGSRSGSQLGAHLNFDVGVANMLLETGLLYMQAGAKNDAILASTEYELDYLALPIGVQYNLSGDAKSYWYLRGGATLAYLMSAKSKTTLLGSTTGGGDIKDQTNSFDLMPYVGIGSMWEVGSGGKLGLDFNYTRGLLKVFKDQASNNDGFIVNLSYGFSI